MPAAGRRARSRRPGRSSECMAAERSPLEPVGHRSPGQMLGFLVGLTLAFAACSPGHASPVRVVDLVREFPGAEMRPTRAAFEVIDFAAADVSRPAIRTTAPSRLVFRLPVPRRGTFQVLAAIDATPGGLAAQP